MAGMAGDSGDWEEAGDSAAAGDSGDLAAAGDWPVPQDKTAHPCTPELWRP